MSRILVAEDDRGIADFICRGLRDAGYATDVAEDGLTAYELARGGEYDLVVLDLGLPIIDGRVVLTRLRQSGVSVPVIVLTARDGVEDTVGSLEDGANDHMTKPFQFAELLARVRLRLTDEAAGDASGRIAHGDLVLDPRTQRVQVDGKWVDLSRREMGLLEVFLRHPGQILSRAQLLGRVWGLDFDPASNVVDVYVRALRRKIGAHRVETIRGSGYRLP
ncbi:MAG TPA: response regulator transcription factor [Corynebacterium sp.]|uniref:response regulator transcription factor n=1 Tax=Corynebacterium sp. TaxID=1720 RepID=UPI0017AC87BB|nr:response regulator transcription factor [Corynebacterium sp.]HHT31230.1 response regulator transcription factor [Corynebacterium sp.]